MNAPLAKKMIVLAAVMPGLALTACAGAVNDGASAPLEPRIAALVAENRGFPRWADFPAVPTDTPRPMDVATRVSTLKITGASLVDEAARIEWTLADSESFAREVAARVVTTPIAPETQATQTDIDAFAQRLRDRGQAPPPVPRR
jgi:hypothetical protein